MPDDEISAEALVGRLNSQGGKFEAVGKPDVLDRWIAAGRRARRLGLIPDGYRLEVQRRYIRAHFALVSGVHPMSKEHRDTIELIPVPERLNHAHPIVRSLRDGNGLEVSRPAKSRALRILQGLIVVAEGRGYSVISGSSGYVCEIEIRGHRFGVKIREQADRVPHVPTVTEKRESERYSWVRIADFDPVPSGRLTIELDQVWRGRQYRWADGKRVQVEDRLGHLLAEIETRALEAEAREAAAERQRQQRVRNWEEAMERARIDFDQHFLSESLIGQLETWTLTTRLRAYCDALEIRLGKAQLDQLPQGPSQWLIWARDFVDSIDPLRESPEMPEIPEPNPEDLKPFLRGWSPYYPDY